MTITDDFAELRRRTDRIDPDELDALFSHAVPVPVEAVAGSRWRGFGFDTGHRMFRQLGRSRWWGKDFTDPSAAMPLLCRTEEGALFSDTESGRGEASLWAVEFRGEATATMVYDGMPVLDHFRNIDDDTLLGVMNGKAMVLDGGRHFYFGLERDLGREPIVPRGEG